MEHAYLHQVSLLSFLIWYTIEAARIQNGLLWFIEIGPSSYLQHSTVSPFKWMMIWCSILITLYMKIEKRSHQLQNVGPHQCLTKENLIWCNTMWSENHYSEFQRKTYSCQKCVLCNQIWCSAWSVQIQIGTTELKKSKVNTHSCLVLSPWSLS